MTQEQTPARTAKNEEAFAALGYDFETRAKQLVELAKDENKNVALRALECINRLTGHLPTRAARSARNGDADGEPDFDAASFSTPATIDTGEASS